jgi:hypothetical protein
MSDCPDTDAILTIADSLDWDVEENLRHLQTCDDCRARIEVLRLAHAGLAVSEPVEPAVLRSVIAAVGTVAAHERRRVRAANRLAQWAEPVLAGVTALVIATSSRVPIDDLGSAVLAFALGVVLLLAGRAIVRRVPALRLENADA